jgi:hypothetical protein
MSFFLCNFAWALVALVLAAAEPFGSDYRLRDPFTLFLHV